MHAGDLLCQASVYKKQIPGRMNLRAILTVWIKIQGLIQRQS